MGQKLKVLIADNLAAEGVAILEESGLFEVDARKKTPREDLLQIIGDFDGLIIRSASKVDQEVLDKAVKLKVVIRAGVGVDNIDIPACSNKGVVVMNAPAGNSISTAEQAIALMFSLARKTHAADASVKSGAWEKSKFTGTQLTGKTMGVIGLGRIGKEVVSRAKGLKMNVLGFDPFIPTESLEYLQINLVDIPQILKQADFISVHTPLTEQTRGLINKENLDQLKPGVRLINCARGGIYDEEALQHGLESGAIGGVGLDVFTQEPLPEEFPLRAYKEAVLTPHLGASTEEAQLEVAKETASSMVEYFKSGVALNSLNFPTFDPKQMDSLSPWFQLAELVGSVASQVLKGAPESITLDFEGPICNHNLKPLEVAAAKGVLSPIYGDEVNLVNAPLLAKEKKMKIFQSTDVDASREDSILYFSLTGAEDKVKIKASVTVTGPIILAVDSFPVEFRPQGNILYIKNKDVPKVIAEVSKLLGDENINIASLYLARTEKGGDVLTIIQVDEIVSDSLLEKMREHSSIHLLKLLQLTE